MPVVIKEFDPFLAYGPIKENEELKAKIKQLEAELADIKETYSNIMDEKCDENEKHCTCVPFLRQRIKQLEES